MRYVYFPRKCNTAGHTLEMVQDYFKKYCLIHADVYSPLYPKEKAAMKLYS